MSDQFIEFTTDKQFIRRVRELKTIRVMVGMYCSHHHGGAPLCADCTELFDYAQRRLQRCVFGDAKPNCAKCVVHCYNADMRERIRVVSAGPGRACCCATRFWASGICWPIAGPCRCCRPSAAPRRPIPIERKAWHQVLRACPSRCVGELPCSRRGQNLLLKQ